MEIPERLRCLFSAEIEQRSESFVIEIPKRELQQGDVEEGETYRVVILSSGKTGGEGAEEAEGDRQQHSQPPGPPVAEGELRDVEIEDTGELGDGIARVERGFVVIIPDTEQGEQVTVEITDVQQNVAFGEVIKRQSP